jgi:ubiquitin carboxyl-terminal hydrolase 16/45
MKDEGGGTWGSQEGASHRSMSLRGMLRELARKYDQYDDYGQQDAHELLRHLLDSMEMEEKDVLKKVQPQLIGGDKGKKRKGSKRPSNAGISPMPSPLPSPAPSVPSSPTRSTADPLPVPRDNLAPVPGQGRTQEYEDVPEEKRLVPFVNVLFGGSLASVVVCENCKSVSHVYSAP